MPIESPWMTTNETAAYARCHVNTVNKAARSGELRGSQTGRSGKWLFHREAVDAWIKGEIAEITVPVVTRRKSA